MKRTVLQSEHIAQNGPRRFRQIRWTILQALVRRANVRFWRILDRPKPSPCEPCGPKAVDGISAAMAEKIYDFFHEKG